MRLNKANKNICQVPCVPLSDLLGHLSRLLALLALALIINHERGKFGAKTTTIRDVFIKTFFCQKGEEKLKMGIKMYRAIVHPTDGYVSSPTRQNNIDI